VYERFAADLARAFDGSFTVSRKRPTGILPLSRASPMMSMVALSLSFR